MSIRNSPDPVLDAARACVLRVGVRRTTLTAVARRAGLSRMTLYRRWPDAASLVADLLTRELDEVVALAARRVTGASARERLVAHLTAAAAGLRENALFGQIVEVDPELLLPYLLDRLGTSQGHVLQLIEAYVSQGHADGSVRPGTAAVQARALLLPLRTYALSGHLLEEGLAPGELAEQLRLLLDAYLGTGSLGGAEPRGRPAAAGEASRAGRTPARRAPVRRAARRRAASPAATAPEAP